jgi:hypothetical protein
LAPPGYEDAVPVVSQAVKDELASVDCAIAPNRDSLLPIMASAHFGRGDKVRWSYLGSRKAVFDEHKGGKSIAQLANAFGEKQSEIKDYLLEYELYQECLKFSWTPAEREALEDPAVAFNPPVRFLQTTGHKQQTGIDFDRPNMKVTFADAEARNKLEHLVRKLVVHPEKGMGATSSYKDVFADYVSPAAKAASSGASGSTGVGQGAGAGGATGGGHAAGTAGGTAGGSGSAAAASSAGGSTASASASGAANGGKVNKGALFNYPITKSSLLMEQLMKEAATLNCSNFPGAGTALLRSIIEAIVKRIIEEQKANPNNKLLSVELAISICLSNTVTLSKDDKKILKDFSAHHLDHVNMSTHATVKPNYLRLAAARDCVDDFVRRNV